MMAHTPFDTLAFANKLKVAGMASGIAEVQAEATAEVIGALMENQLATKQDLVALELKISSLIIKSMLTSITVIIGIQTLLHFVR